MLLKINSFLKDYGILELRKKNNEEVLITLVGIG